MNPPSPASAWPVTKVEPELRVGDFHALSITRQYLDFIGTNNVDDRENAALGAEKRASAGSSFFLLTKEVAHLLKDFFHSVVKIDVVRTALPEMTARRW